MSLFEFTMVLLSIVVGLGLTKILAGFSHALLAKQISRESWLPLLLIALVFITLVQVWFEAWIHRDQSSWHFTQLLLILLNPTLIYILTHLMFPLSSEVSLHEHYFERHRLIFSVVSLAALSAMIYYPLGFDAPLFSLYNLSSGVTALGAAVLAISPNRTIHAVFLVLGALLVVFDIASTGARISLPAA